MSSSTIRDRVLQERKLQNFKLSRYPDATEDQRRLRIEVQGFILALDYILEANSNDKEDKD